MTFSHKPSVREIPRDRLDTRTDEEILESLRNPLPVTSERNVWTFWDKGLGDIPSWTRRNIINWARRLPKEWNIYVLDIVPGSPLNVDNFLDKSNFYTAFNNRTIGGLNSGVWYSDIIRLASLHTHGGVWVDSGIILMRDFSQDIWQQLEDPNSPYEIAGFSADIAPVPDNDNIASWFIAARKGSPFMKQWNRVLKHIWDTPLGEEGDERERRDYHGLSTHPLFRQVKKQRVKVDHQAKYKVDPVAFNDYLHTYLSCKRVRMTVDAAAGWDGPAWWESHAMILPLRESYLTYLMTDFSGLRQFELLSAQRDVPPPQRGADWQAAEELVQALIRTCCNVKLSHGLKTTKNMHVATLWEKDEYVDYDVKEGTFAAYLRWASLHLEQVDRPLEPFDVPTTGTKIHADLLEEVEE
ncbi:capsule polysaccharide biosynthesis protein [Diaporthe helianthi]|uniref:Capsule polysaccharide biosynthesis protein n=1 Tax=Diaporthe helianthi TaxID=158607 RepID=A0A2P5HEY2_DIAHE|nr:capsule polysaccharide biosynthesis protein [Diaporthe helianthi]